MSRNRAPNLQIVGDLSEDEAVAQPELPPDIPIVGLQRTGQTVQTPAAVLPVLARTPPPPRPLQPASVTMPMDTGELPSEFAVHLDLRLSVPQSTALRRIALALDRQGAKLASGQRVVTVSHAVRYLLEQFSS